jgi:hypothetical protein
LTKERPTTPACLASGLCIAGISTRTLATSDVVRVYKSLSQVEHAFRSIKTVDLEIRPIHHRLSDRVRAHVLLCMLVLFRIAHAPGARSNSVRRSSSRRSCHRAMLGIALTLAIVTMIVA